MQLLSILSFIAVIKISPASITKLPTKIAPNFNAWVGIKYNINELFSFTGWYTMVLLKLNP